MFLRQGVWFPNARLDLHFFFLIFFLIFELKADTGRIALVSLHKFFNCQGGTKMLPVGREHHWAAGIQQWSHDQSEEARASNALSGRKFWVPKMQSSNPLRETLLQWL